MIETAPSPIESRFLVWTDHRAERQRLTHRNGHLVLERFRSAWAHERR